MFVSLQKLHPSKQRRELFLNLNYQWAKNYQQPTNRIQGGAVHKGPG